MRVGGNFMFVFSSNELGAAFNVMVMIALVGTKIVEVKNWNHVFEL